MINLDFARMKPVPNGAHRGLLTGQPNYLGGRLDGTLAPAGFQPYRRTEQGQPIADDQPFPPEHYLLFVVDGGYLWHYVHVSLLPADYLPQQSGE